MEREKIAWHIINFGIKIKPSNPYEPLDIKKWQKEIAEEPFNLREASEYLGVSPLTLKKWVNEGKIVSGKTGREYHFDVNNLKKFKKTLVLSSELLMSDGIQSPQSVIIASLC